MALIGRLFIILFAFLAACLVAGMIVIGAVLFPEFSDLGSGPVDQGALNVVLGFGFIFISGFALLPALLVVAITEAFYVRGALTYAVGGGLVGLGAGYCIAVRYSSRARSEACGLVLRRNQQKLSAQAQHAGRDRA